MEMQTAQQALTKHSPLSFFMLCVCLLRSWTVLAQPHEAVVTYSTYANVTLVVADSAAGTPAVSPDLNLRFLFPRASRVARDIRQPLRPAA